MENKQEQLFGLVARFRSASQLLSAAGKVRKEGYVSYDAHSPFPIHGMDKAMGLGDSHLGWIVFTFALIGGIGGFALMAWASSIEYPLIISGKPFISTEAFIPVTFELTILFSAFSTVIGMLTLNKLPMWYHPLFESSGFSDVTCDGFFISVEAIDPQFEVEKTKDFLVSIGGFDVETVFG